MHPDKLGRYEIVRVLGKGAMGVVYEGRDPNLDRRVALKTIMVDGLGAAAAAEYEERFRTEARSAARLQHPNIVTVHDCGRDGDTAFLVMEFIQGEDLKQYLDGGGRHSIAQALRLLHDLLAALDFAHRQGVVHRDIKPANLLVEAGGHLKLTDFGVARIAGEATRTQGSMIGTLKYMAPEQVQGLKVDSRADLFSAGVVAYQLLTGARPFDGDNDFSIIQQVIGHTPPPPSSIAPQLPPAVDPVLARALAKNRDERFQTAAEFSQALREAFAGLDADALAAMQPPAPALLPAAAATAPMTLPPLATVPGAPITHELELEYWRDVRDTGDPRELEGFLARFPQGIYADLARRRLDRLDGGSPDPEQTVLRGMTSAPAAAQLPAGGTVTASATPAAPPEPSSPARSDETAAGAATQADASAAHAPVPIGPQQQPRRPGRGWVAAIAVTAGLAIAVALLAGRSGGSGQGEAMASPGAPALAPAPAAAAAAPVPVTPVSTTPHAGSAAARGKAPPAAAPHPAAARAAARRDPAVQAVSPVAAPAAPSPATTAEPAGAAGDKPELAAAVRQGTGAQGSQRLVPPSETCGDKMYLLRQFCLQAECAKPGYQSFPACQKLKELARLREESKVRN